MKTKNVGKSDVDDAIDKLLIGNIMESFTDNHYLCKSKNDANYTVLRGVFLGKGVLRICNKFTGEHPYRSAISIKLLNNFFEITLWHGCSPVKLLHIFKRPFLKNTSGRLLLTIIV